MTDLSPNNTAANKAPATNAPESAPASASASASATTHFGFRTVSENEKAGLVRNVFEKVAGRYDLMNDLMSMGIHRLWKSSLLDWLAPQPGMALLDVAGGTGDIARGFLARCAKAADSAASGSSAIICDINPAMIEAGRDRAFDKGLAQGLAHGLGWACGDAEKLPFADNSMDAYTVGFGLRNVTHIPEALSEARRVLKPGGRFLCLEFSHVVLPVLDRLYDLYSFNVLPTLGEMVANDRESYVYLAESIRRFPDQASFAAMVSSAGFDQVTYRNLSGGIAALHSGWRL
ncbi:MAG: bifunctional demethylmenaquinone methyltransferase/2-methoxy-6-polyprenyl-1,4-benzoquinol methylase UbiE [Rhodospirillaceae bacterium]|jgi:demethylmenaquinone methyltransferase / 2-methoxy-6-polyprenyl-1,4-benzoquinol methylase|nr:bifunctional demethylmenaquinone methyltransferase/2-methoxy-6-polyprenyl-1,4-benzoquinol methylase UbiE [Rhodospirillaceae bacterium]MBT5374055.1 bifunctional demethylmenaquinone methyltransferase/2-methoxy-6-polyprenyl-1,4-benzoquinol methylase UbiE [Rhodospirillaceae bacterium]MBT5751080.1 bifunctional demethylmenaquinone methyltransferase/2-methoxy-6-polyprenyl-1,4-benzoquinol methylase UbiE [Rhodospirillaceae bacterium]